MMTATLVPHPDVALSLALAVIASSHEPLLLLDGASGVVAASHSFCRAFDLDSGSVAGASVFAMGHGEWEVPQLRSLLTATASGDAEIGPYEMDLKGGAHGTRRLVLNAHRLVYDDPGEARVLLAVTDVTDARQSARAQDELLREKAILLQEVQHRIANSLQIIASVLMQSARKVQSGETREQLRIAHHRIVSVAAVQQQLTTSSLGGVALKSYFTKLCDSLAASMIPDPKRLSLAVTADDSVASPEVSVSLGLIVTELVINALKHAFPHHRRGRVAVSYAGGETGWTLSVADNGIGMPANPADAKPGLGTSIIEALARQLSARISVTNARPGTAVSIVHTASGTSGASRDPAVQAV